MENSCLNLSDPSIIIIFNSNLQFCADDVWLNAKSEEITKQILIHPVGVILRPVTESKR